jgi:lantibiotic modifying enzyme
MMAEATAPPAWEPILEGEAAAPAAAAVTAVAEALGNGPLTARQGGPSLSAGEAGLALFFDYLDRARPGAGYGEIAQQRLDRAIDSLASSSPGPSLYFGFTGVAWTVEHLLGVAGAGAGQEEGEDDPNAEIDAALLTHLEQWPYAHDYDLISGLVGYGVYALERLPRPMAIACLEAIVERLADIATERPEGLAWHTPRDMMPEPNRPSYPEGADNLGVAHGTPGVIALLARTHAAGVAMDRTRSLLAGAVPWLLAQKLPAGGISFFPYAVGRSVRIRPARTAWCYGDPGISFALLAAGRALREPAWEREGRELARAVARRPAESCGVEDAGLCHGAAGLGHLLNRLYHASGEPELLGAARAWFGRALVYREPGRGIGGFLALTPPPDNPDELVWNDDAGFLSGSVGIALCLLAATSGVEPGWDRVLLISPLP